MAILMCIIKGLCCAEIIFQMEPRGYAFWKHSNEYVIIDGE